MIFINDIEVPVPVREVLHGQEYYVANVYVEDLVSSSTWTDCAVDKRWLARGLLHLTKDHAIAHAEALLSFTRAERWWRPFLMVDLRANAPLPTFAGSICTCQSLQISGLSWGFTVNVYIVKIEGLSALVYVHKAHNVTQWKVHTLAEVPKERQEQALAKQQRIAHKRNCAVKTVEINRPPWTIDVLVATATTNPEN